MRSMVLNVFIRISWDVRYLSSGFEYFLNRFAWELVPMGPTLVPDRTRRALSIPLITFFDRCFLPHKNCKIPPKNPQNLSISCANLIVKWFYLEVLDWQYAWIYLLVLYFQYLFFHLTEMYNNHLYVFDERSAWKPNSIF